MKTRTHVILIVAALAATMYGCSGQGYGPTTPSATTDPGTSAGGSVVSIPAGASNLGTTAFGAAATVAAGSTVTWRNTDNTAHTATANAGAFNSGPIAPGGSFSVVLSTPGTFTYHCTIHPDMVGTITVQ